MSFYEQGLNVQTLGYRDSQPAPFRDSQNQLMGGMLCSDEQAGQTSLGAGLRVFLWAQSGSGGHWPLPRSSAYVCQGGVAHGFPVPNDISGYPFCPGHLILTLLAPLLGDLLTFCWLPLIQAISSHLETPHHGPPLRDIHRPPGSHRLLQSSVVFLTVRFLLSVILCNLDHLRIPQIIKSLQQIALQSFT